MAEKNRRDWLGTAMFRKFGCDIFQIDNVLRGGCLYLDLQAKNLLSARDVHTKIEIYSQKAVCYMPQLIAFSNIHGYRNAQT